MRENYSSETRAHRVRRDPAVALWLAAAAAVWSLSAQLAAGQVPPCEFRLQGQANQSYLIEASEDMVHWTVISTNDATSDGSIYFSDARAGAVEQRFYRPLSRNLFTAAGSWGGRILVKPKGGAQLGPLHRALGVRVLHTFAAIGRLQACQTPPGQATEALIRRYQQSGLVEYAEPDSELHALREPNDFRFTDGSLWSFYNFGQLDGVPDADVDASEAWDIRFDAGDVIVAVIDTGIRTTHEDLQPNLWSNPGEIPGNGIDDDGNGFVDDVHGINTLDNSGSPEDDYGHGSHVSGILGAVGNNLVGVAGVCWRVQIMACKFLNAQGDGSVSDAVRCIDYARRMGAKVINASFGRPEMNSQALYDAIAGARDADIVFVAACGNSQNNNDITPLYPASYDLDNILAVAATTRADALASFSNFGQTTVDLGAPGEPIFSCWNTADNAYQYFVGTSMAAPHVAGAAALLRAQFPNENYRQIVNRILGSTDPLPALAGKCSTGGRLNVFRALSGSPPVLPVINVVAADADASEGGDPGAFVISRTGSTNSALLVAYTLGGTAENGVDYQTLDGSLVISAGSSSGTVALIPIDDAGAEGDEGVILTLSARAAYNIGAARLATVTIADDDSGSRPVVSLSMSAGLILEGGGAVEGIVRRDGDIGNSLTVRYSLCGTAVNGADYWTLPGFIVIPAGASTATFALRPIDDTLVEADEFVTVTLNVDDAYEINPVGNPSVVAILDND
jgi:subtilisin family serine protease